MKALYRRYRPKTLSEVVGQEQITSVLEKSIQNGKIAHAYLFIGPRGTGKTSVARILAHEINGFKYELEDDYLDIIEIDAASNTGVDNIRDLREKAIIAPAKGKYKVYIIDEVHMLSKSAFNALLKTLEEPPEHVIFIMATTDAYKIPVTITSRSQTFTFKLANPGVMFDHLKKIAKKEKINITDEALEIVVKRGGGSFRDSLSLLDQISTLSDNKIDADLITKALGLPQTEAITNILNGYAAGDIARVRDQLKDLLETGIKPEVVAENLISEIMANPQPIHLGLLDSLLDVSRSSYPEAKLLLALIPRNTTTIAQPVYATAPAVAPAPVATPAPKPVAKPVTKPTPKAEPKAEPEAEPKAEATTTQAEVAEPEAAIDTPQPTPAPAVIPEPSADDAEIWNNILVFTHEKIPGINKYLEESDYILEGDKLTIYAKKKFNKDQIVKKVPMIAEFLNGKYTIEVNAETLAKDAEMAAIAELMGGGEEVQIDAVE
ncbi:MAG: DNA polymerase III subunit gamma/tau [Candidatus Saccharibacteria bacterium]|nr:DNA polymerase III subunit gamma/tau [Candidatus Saccharibacteria bacterium]